jgi:hypothetical protein
MSDTNDWLADTQATVIDGMNRGREPELISEQQAHFLRNVSTRGGRVHSRPRFVQRAVLPSGLLQGGTVFRSRVVAAVGGQIWELDPKNWAQTEKTATHPQPPLPPGAPNPKGPNNPKCPRVWFCETPGTLVIQDGQARPWVYDGADFRRAADDEVPVGRAMAYANGRLAVAVNGGRDVRLGDIRQPAHQSELKFTETYNLTGGGDFSFPSEVLAMKALPVIDTGSGQGALIVGCSDSVHTLKTQITQRDMWSEVGFQTILLPNRGIVGANAVVAVNQDLYFRSSDGLRSLRTSTADYDAPGLAPLSVEVRHRFDFDTPFLLQDASVVYFDNRLLCTHSPFVYSSRSLAQGLIALNFDSLSSRGQKSAPVYDGEWDGVIIAQAFTGQVQGVERCFILGRDIVGQNGLWELLPEVAEQRGDEPTQVIESRMLFGDSPGVLKALRRCDAQFSDIRGGLNVRVYFRPEKYPYWVTWDNFTVDSPGPRAWGPRKQPQHRSLLSTRSVPEGVDPATQRPRYVATGFQVRIEWDGYARLDYFQVFQARVPMTPYADNPASGASAEEVAAPPGTYEPTFWHTHPVSPLAGI